MDFPGMPTLLGCTILKLAVILSERSESKDLHLPPSAEVQILRLRSG